MSLLTDFDLYLLSDGAHPRTYQNPGAHLCQLPAAPRTDLTLSAPNATAASRAGSPTRQPCEP